MTLGAPPVGFTQKGDLLVPKADLLVPVGFVGGGAVSFSDPSSYSGLQSWGIADNISGVDGDAVATWADESGQGHDLSQATAGNQPQLVRGATGANGHDAVLFDEAGPEFLTHPDDPAFRAAESGDPGWTAFAVVFMDGTADWASHRALFHKEDEWGLYSWDSEGGTNSSEWVARHNGDRTPTGTDSHSDASWYIVTVRGVPESSLTCRVNGSLYNSVASTESNSTTSVLALGKGTEFTNPFGGMVAEFGMYNEPRSDSELANIEGYLNDRFAVY